MTKLRRHGATDSAASAARATLPRAVILTALPVEYCAAREFLTDLDEVVHEGTVYETGLFTDPNGSPLWLVSLVQVGQGNNASAVESERAIREHKPEVLIFLGIAGGVKDVRLGDVVAATKVYGYEYGKDFADGFRTRPSVAESSYALVQRAMAESRRENWKARRPSDERLRGARAHVGPIAAGEKVVNSSESAIAKFLRDNYGDTLAIEMEGRGFLAATHANAEVQGIVIRGISDLLDKKADSDAEGWQESASQAAAAFSFEVLAKLKPVSRTAGEGTPSPEQRFMMDAFGVRSQEELVQQLIGTECSQQSLSSQGRAVLKFLVETENPSSVRIGTRFIAEALALDIRVLEEDIVPELSHQNLLQIDAYDPGQGRLVKLTAAGRRLGSS